MECEDLKVSECTPGRLDGPGPAQCLLSVVSPTDCWFYQELPRPDPVRTRLPSELFGEALMVLEFLRAFGEVFDLKDEFPDGVSLG